MLHDHLGASLPGRDVTVVNMGRGAGTTMDSYYFLATIARLSPDFIVFYQGGNDFFTPARNRSRVARGVVSAGANGFATGRLCSAPARTSFARGR
jgi:hypothetical protein